MEAFSFNPPINLAEEGKWLLAVTYFETTNSVFNITDENNSFSIGTPGFWRIPKYLPEGLIERLKRIIRALISKRYRTACQRSRKKGHSNRNRKQWYNLAGFDHFKSEILAELRRVKYHHRGYGV